MSRGESIQTYGLAGVGIALAVPKTLYEVYGPSPSAEQHSHETSKRVGRGIIGLLAYASIYDTLADKTISAEYRELKQHDAVTAYAGLLIIGAHMVGKLPFDPIDKFAGGARKHIRSKFMGKNPEPLIPKIHATIGV